ncbi:MAG: TylF/MycF/NovP-related O-methyltransferase [Patescibacteria group bacterium]
MKAKKSTQAAESLNLYDAFLAEAGIDRLQKILARYELLKMAERVPGDIVECGVFKGSGLYTLAKIHSLLAPQGKKRIIGFDFFDEVRKMTFAKSEDEKVQKRHERGWSAQKAILENLENAGITNVELIAGNVIATTKAYPKKHLGFRIALLSLDVDNYESTLAILKNLFPAVSPGGVVAFDEYGLPGFGESDAVDEYFKGKNIKLQSLPFARTPSAYLIKGSA